MPMNRKDYPANWEQASATVRFIRARYQCECTGECGRHQPLTKPGPVTPAEPPLVRRCNEIHKQEARHSNGRIILTAAHTCNCYPLCANPDHLLAMCQACHLRFDMARHRASRLRTILNPSYKARRYRNAGKALHIENLVLLSKLPKKKRTHLWLGRNQTPPAEPT